jgi:hypothetical protein
VRDVQSKEISNSTAAAEAVIERLQLERQFSRYSRANVTPREFNNAHRDKTHLWVDNGQIPCKGKCGREVTTVYFASTTTRGD